ncbi:MAG: Hsp20/alpha crystallin family protein [Polyangiaceae bacterium]|jgi:HSP20 family molecular chaperone IbpA|nr:Hsp20/alpha crystallin family protein [Polyangiaceae bacterium]
MTTESKLTRREERLPEKVDQLRTVVPAVDIYENNTEILLVADMPGVDRKALEIQLDHDRLSISGTMPAPAEGLLATEFQPCRYARAFTVAQAIDGDKVTAELDKGVLRVHLPKAAHAQPRQIHVTDG